MAVLRKITIIIALCLVCICCLNDAVQHMVLWLVADCILLGLLLALLLPQNQKLLIKTGCTLAFISGLLLLHTSLKSYTLLIPALACILTLGAQFLYHSPKNRRYFFILLYSLTFFSGTHSFWPHLIYSHYSPSKVAVLEHGKWGNALSYERKLTITSQYSYDLLHRLIQATKIEHISELKDFTELCGLSLRQNPLANKRLRR